MLTYELKLDSVFFNIKNKQKKILKKKKKNRHSSSLNNHIIADH